MEKGTNSRASSGSSYEVFLSFRGLDTRHTFTDFLYHGMVEAGILVFRDSESLHVGEKISKLLQAIENSKFYIPIFSKNYASSDWCLRELAHMVECTSRSNGNKEIMPIFFDVEPADVKLKTTLYEQALSKRGKICSEVESWEKALTEVGKIIGWNWKKDESQATLIKSVIETVLRKLNVGYKKIVTEDLVGVDDRVEAIIKKLDMGSDSVQFLVIHGMGGIGKTTLAKVIFNRLSSSFHECDFLSDVGESSRRHGMVKLQKQLLSKYLDSDSLKRIYDVDDGINMIKRVLCNKKVLIVLDDVDDEEQLKSLTGKDDWFGFGSRIIITTRDQRVLTNLAKAIDEGLANILAYEVGEMEFDHALKLFSRHAFRRDSPLDQYISLSEKIVHTLGKLPLALQVIGSLLSGKSETFWEDTLKKLEKAPPMEVQKKLMITYEKLDDEQKQVFLDIACFFVNEDTTYPSYMWDACGYCPDNALEVLFLMSLIKIKDDNTFWMHDQVRDLGREIVRKENFDDPCKRSRVWNHEQALRILKQQEGSRDIKALSIQFRKDRDFLEGDTALLEADEFANLEKLRLFLVDCVSFIGDFNNLLSDLRMLCCRGFYFDNPSIFQTKNFHPTNLVVLNLSHCNISEESIDWIKVARKLKVLDLSHCYYLRRMPDLSTLVSLEILILTKCRHLERIDWIEALRKLKILDLCQCYDLKRLPDLSTLVSLETLILQDCFPIIKLPDSIGKLQSLIELDLSGLGIDHLPDSFSNLKQLTTLRMKEIKGGLTKLPSAIWFVQLVTRPFESETSELYCLKMPDLSWTQISGLPTVASLVSNIHKLEIAAPEIAAPEIAAPDSRRFWDPTWDFLDVLENIVTLPGTQSWTRESIEKLENVVVLEPGTQSQMENQILASPNMRFLLQLPSSLRDSVFRELETSDRLHFSILWWMPIVVGICDSELEKRLLQDCLLSRRLELFSEKMLDIFS